MNSNKKSGKTETDTLLIIIFLFLLLILTIIINCIWLDLTTKFFLQILMYWKYIIFCTFVYILYIHLYTWKLMQIVILSICWRRTVVMPAVCSLLIITLNALSLKDYKIYCTSLITVHLKATTELSAELIQS